MHRRMLSSVSRDLKTPLASIIGSLEVYDRMRDKLPPDRQQTLIRVALQEAYRLDAFITNILDMAKLDNNLIKAQRESVDIENLVRHSTMRLSHRLQDCDVHIDVKDRLMVLADPSLLGRATLMLVLDNAVKYGGTPPAIRVVCNREGTRRTRSRDRCS